MSPGPVAGRIRLVGKLLGTGTESRRLRRGWALRLTRPANLFQPWNDTCADRYPELFAFLGDQLAGSEDARVLSFGCSTGEEVFSLRRYLPSAYLKGIDISRGNVAECRRRLRHLDDHRIEFVRAGSSSAEPDGGYDAVLCMAVFRHGSLADLDVGASCGHLIRFDAFAATMADLARCLKPQGLLVIEHANFRFADSEASRNFDVVLRRRRTEEDGRTPIFGDDNRRMEEPDEVGVIFRKTR
ncbi:MAG: class I SAM-dependent methyltransferase [Acidimicrobiales bacterium]